MHMHIATVAESALETDPCRACVWIRLRSPTPPATAQGDGDFKVLTCNRGNMKETGGHSMM